MKFTVPIFIFHFFLDKKWSKSQDFRKVLCNSTVHFLARSQGGGMTA